jgi:TonB-like protein
LGRECQEDEEIRRDVELLLVTRDQIPDWLNEPLLVVVMEASIGADGRVQSVRVVTGHPLLVEAATEAVRATV